MNEKIQQFVENIIIKNNDHCEAISELFKLLNKHEAHRAVLNYKLSTNLNKNKTILVDQILGGLDRLIDVHPEY